MRTQSCIEGPKNVSRKNFVGTFTHRPALRHELWVRKLLRAPHEIGILRLAFDEGVWGVIMWRQMQFCHRTPSQPARTVASLLLVFPARQCSLFLSLIPLWVNISGRAREGPKNSVEEDRSDPLT